MRGHVEDEQRQTDERQRERHPAEARHGMVHPPDGGVEIREAGREAEAEGAPPAAGAVEGEERGDEREPREPFEVASGVELAQRKPGQALRQRQGREEAARHRQEERARAGHRDDLDRDRDVPLTPALSPAGGEGGKDPDPDPDLDPGAEGDEAARTIPSPTSASSASAMRRASAVRSWSCPRR